MIKTILFIMGTRPEAIKMLPVYLELKKVPNINPITVTTGQHGSMIDQVFEVFELSPDVKLEVDNRGGSLNNLASMLFSNLNPVLDSYEPEGVLVQGDTSSALVGALAAFHKQISVYHIEAGLRTNNLRHPFPEEGYRQMISRIATYNFAPTESARSNLQKEGIHNTMVTGNTVIDALHIISKIVNGNIDFYKKIYSKAAKEFVLVTGHRRENFGEGLKNICTAIKKLASVYDSIDFIYPVHLNPNVRDNVLDWLGGIPNIILIDPLRYDELVYLIMNAKVIISDSGGIQEEAPSFGVPVLVTRETTERPEAVEEGFNFLVGTDPGRIMSRFESVYKSGIDNSKPNPYGDGKASQRIVEFLLKQ